MRLLLLRPLRPSLTLQLTTHPCTPFARSCVMALCSSITRPYLLEANLSLILLACRTLPEAGAVLRPPAFCCCCCCDSSAWTADTRRLPWHSPANSSSASRSSMVTRIVSRSTRPLGHELLRMVMGWDGVGSGAERSRAPGKTNKSKSQALRDEASPTLNHYCLRACHVGDHAFT